ncbi:hypothetical protein HanXRQr2_Chr16g0767811 [Helianthus annuus]|uniref:Uncharacterized protein n=1 Tax=Helianthus annuus TaxID=4232 RepID=A0A9K3DWP5_HELAN|nr:hypothetical protein HanXRQr2_Chr16g0767811 [Helianthus annuus]KAJ0822774.1 hypothetical protein HanPSC8_Chr16g0735981 [Helianthus annuus]
MNVVLDCVSSCSWLSKFSEWPTFCLSIQIWVNPIENIFKQVYLTLLTNNRI